MFFGEVQRHTDLGVVDSFNKIYLSIQIHIGKIQNFSDRQQWLAAVSTMLAEHSENLRRLMVLPNVPVMVASVENGVIRYQSRPLPGRRAEDVEGLPWDALFKRPGVLTDPSGMLEVGHRSMWFGGLVVHGIVG